MNKPVILLKLSRHWVIRCALLILFSWITLYVLIVAWTNFTGARSWAAAQAMLQREGETLDFKKLIPAPPPDDKNFFAIEPLRDIAKPGTEGVEEERRLALRGAGFWNTKGKQPALELGPAFGQPVDVAAWASFFAKNGWINTNQVPEMTAEKLLAALKEAKPLLKTLSDVAPSYQHASFLPHLGGRLPDGSLFQLQMPHYQGLQSATASLALRSILAAKSGNAADSLKSALALVHLAQAMSEEPFLIGLLVSATLQRPLGQATWEMLAARILADEQLRTLQSALTRLDNEKTSLLAMRGELASAIGTAQFAENNRVEALQLLTPLSDGKAGAAKPSATSQVLALLVNRGFFDHNKTTLVEMEFSGIIRPLRDGGLSAVISSAPALEQRCSDMRSVMKPGSMFAALAMPAVSSVFRTVILAEAIRRQSIIACALERHFISAGSYPETLDALVPTLLPSVPLDPCDNKPMRYARTEQSRYRIWSVGFDGKDDHGAVNGKNSGDLKKPDYKGDWCWRYER